MRFEVAPLPLDVVVCFFLWTGIVPSLWEFVWNVSRNGICLYYYLVYPSLGRLYFTHNSGWHRTKRSTKTRKRSSVMRCLKKIAFSPMARFRYNTSGRGTTTPLPFFDNLARHHLFESTSYVPYFAL